MGQHHQKLREKAIAAYEASDLKQRDVEKNKEAANRIKQFLSKFEIDEKVNSNLFEIDGIRFYGYPLEDNVGVFGYRIMASRKCSQCEQRIVLEITDEDELTPAMFGQWLAEPHLCEFTDEKQERKEIGFKAVAATS